MWHDEKLLWRIHKAVSRRNLSCGPARCESIRCERSIPNTEGETSIGSKTHRGLEGGKDEAVEAQFSITYPAVLQSSFPAMMDKQWQRWTGNKLNEDVLVIPPGIGRGQVPNSHAQHTFREPIPVKYMQFNI